MIKTDYISDSAYKILQFRRKIALVVTLIFTALYVYDIFAYFAISKKIYGASTIIFILSILVIPVYIASVSNFFDILKEIKAFHQYNYLIFDQNITSIDDISDITAESYESARDKLKAMIEKGLYVNLFINEKTGSVFFGDATPDKKHEQTSAKEIICMSCGAVNSKSNKICDYCGSPL